MASRWPSTQIPVRTRPWCAASMRRPSPKRALPRPFKMPWGQGEIVEEASFKSKWHEPAIQLMKYENGTYSLRFAHYSKGGAFQRAPLMLSTADLGKLKKALAKT